MTMKKICDACDQPIVGQEVYVPMQLIRGETIHFHKRHKVILINFTDREKPMTAEVGPGGEP